MHASRGHSPATSLTPAEAEILVYVSPYAHQVRSSGFDIIPSRTDVRQQPGFVDFYVVTTAPKPKGGGLETPAYFAINVRTGTLWDAGSGTRVESTELRDVQGVIRKSHNIGPGTLARYDSLRPE